jgi:very-short-patch-repair endonuclease
MGAGVPMSRLKWHYRSAHESLISFSNVQFYESDLYTFPSVETGNETYGLQFEYLPNGVYEGKGLNAIEARRVADEVVRFAKEQLECRAMGDPTKSLGVGTFNLRQQLAILDELEQRRREDPSIEPFFDRGGTEPFFVKNLENIQGDERDVIFISVTYARATDGRLRYNFGPLNGENGWRRLNVLTTRARQRMKVFSSMKGDEINAAATTSRGANLLREFLLFAERGRLESVSASLTADTESPFERDVVTELTNRGVTVVPQIGVAGYRIDLAVLDEAVPGRFLCGIECDGVAYHSAESARDRDRLRQQVLEARGWVIHRVWSTDWFKDRPGQIERLLKLIEEARLRARQDVLVERQTRERAAEEAKRRKAEETEAARQEAADLAASGASIAKYERPIATAYTTTPDEGVRAGTDLLEVPLSQLVQAVVTVVETESPIHETDLFTRVASLSGTRAGRRIQGRVEEACASAERSRLIQRRGKFYWNAGGTCQVRTRATVRTPAERIAPEEYQAAVLMVLSTGHGFSRGQLTTEVRSIFGFSRTGAALDEAIGGAIGGLLSQGKIGEASTGIQIRR